MTWKQLARKAVENAIGVRMFRHNHRGINPFVDIRSWGYPITTIFDVGANEGHVARDLINTFPEARLECFEPVEKTYLALTRNTPSVRCRCHRLAMGALAGMATIHVGDNSLMSSILDSSGATSTETIAVSTVDDFVNDHSIKHIDLLKIDTEGFDIEVLKGAEATLLRGEVKFIFTEVGFADEPRHVPLPLMMDHLQARNFSFAGLYDQNWTMHEPATLLYANALFVHDGLYSR